MANRGPALDRNVLTIEDLEHHGAKKLPVMFRDYYNGGAMDMITLRDNKEAYNRYKILPRVLRNVSQVDTSSEIFGEKVTFPLGISPSAMQKMAHPEGELATSRAAANMGLSMCLSSYATTSLEEVKAQGHDNPYMIHMCVVEDRNITKQLLERAEVLGRRLNEYRNNFTLPKHLTFPNILSSGQNEFTTGTGHTAYDASLEWQEIVPWLKKNTKMQVWLKGILNPSDVSLAIEHGIDGIIVSNHGGRQLDGVPATLDCLRACADVARGKIQIAVDGGIRRGSDIFKAVALGAQHCFVGRIAIWGLAYKGQEGVELGLKLLLEEFKMTMALAGCRKVSDITADHLTWLDSKGRLAKL